MSDQQRFSTDVERGAHTEARSAPTEADGAHRRAQVRGGGREATRLDRPPFATSSVEALVELERRARAANDDRGRFGQSFAERLQQARHGSQRELREAI